MSPKDLPPEGTSGSGDNGDEEDRTSEELQPLVPKRCDDDRVKFLPVVLAAASMIIVGTAAGVFFEGWQFITALYITCQIVTTVGYGDFTVHTGVMQGFCALYALVLIVLVAYVLNLGIEKVNQRNADLVVAGIHAEAQAMANAIGQGRRFSFVLEAVEVGDMERRFQRNKNVIGASGLAALFILFGTVFYATYESCTCSYGQSHVNGCDLASFETCSRTGGYVKSWVSSFYMSVITLTTIGFGDYTPRSRMGRLVAIPWMILGVASMAKWVAEVQHFFFEQRHQAKKAKVPQAVRDSLFGLASVDDRETLGRSEYRTYMLLQQGVVTKEQIGAIDAHFDRVAPASSARPGRQGVTRADLRARHATTS